MLRGRVVGKFKGRVVIINFTPVQTRMMRTPVGVRSLLCRHVRINTRSRVYTHLDFTVANPGTRNEARTPTTKKQQIPVRQIYRHDCRGTVCSFCVHALQRSRSMHSLHKSVIIRLTLRACLIWDDYSLFMAHISRVSPSDSRDRVRVRRPLRQWRKRC